MKKEFILGLILIVLNAAFLIHLQDHHTQAQELPVRGWENKWDNVDAVNYPIENTEAYDKLMQGKKLPALISFQVDSTTGFITLEFQFTEH